MLVYVWNSIASSSLLQYLGSCINILASSPVHSLLYAGVLMYDLLQSNVHGTFFSSGCLWFLTSICDLQRVTLDFNTIFTPIFRQIKPCSDICSTSWGERGSPAMVDKMKIIAIKSPVYQHPWGLNGHELYLRSTYFVSDTTLFEQVEGARQRERWSAYDECKGQLCVKYYLHNIRSLGRYYKLLTSTLIPVAIDSHLVASGCVWLILNAERTSTINAAVDLAIFDWLASKRERERERKREMGKGGVVIYPPLHKI